MIVFNKGKAKKPSSLENLFDAENFLNDDTQHVLLPYIKKTEDLLNEALIKYDKNASATIVPSFDLGFTYNVARLAGGFTTGMLIDWKSNIPFIPVDTTLNVCSSSVYKLMDAKYVSEMMKHDRLNTILELFRQRGFLFDFSSGNHFINLSIDSKGCYFLLIHSSDNNYKNLNNGTFPNEKAWYYNKIKKYYSHNKDRYISYIVGEEAQKYIDFALKNQFNNASFHKQLAKEISKGFCDSISGSTYNHYGMYNSHSILIGTYLLEEKDIAPIFSNINYPIILYSPNQDMWSINIDGIKKYLIPHGWGQEIKKVISIKHHSALNKISILLDKNELLLDNNYYNRIAKNIVTVRRLYQNENENLEKMSI